MASFTIPNSGGFYEPDVLVEFNPCHDPKSGQFASRNAGRCSDAARSERKHLAATLRSHTQGAAWAKGRRELRKSTAHLPAFMWSDAKRASKSDRVGVADYSDSTPTSGAEQATKLVKLGKDAFLSGLGKSGRLSTLRHEIGHIMPDNFARQARVLGLDPHRLLAAAKDARYKELVGSALDYGRRNTHIPESAFDEMEKSGRENAHRFVEELRAWRNAVKFGGGRIDMKAASLSLGTYGEVAFGSKGRAFVDRAVAHLKRYARRVRKTFNAEVRKAVQSGGWSRSRRRAMRSAW
jgi:hypothetical protein